jgi:hypothetical protein
VQQQRSSPRPPQPRLPSRVTLRLNGREYVGEGMTRLEALAEAVEQCAPLLREALQAKRAREAQAPAPQPASPPRKPYSKARQLGGRA